MWQIALRRSIVMETYITYLEKVRQWVDDGRESIPLVEVIELLIPCILHFDNRIAGKILTVFLRRFYDSWVGSKMEFIWIMEETFQRKVLESELSPSHWKLKYTNVKDSPPQIDAVQVRNNVARCIMAKIDPIIETAIPDGNNSTRSKLILAVAKYRDRMRILTTHRALDNEEKQFFQDCMDDFFELWVELFGEEGVSNYIHLLGAGHMLYFLEKYDCLYLYSPSEQC
jgi:hypothetical protein